MKVIQINNQVFILLLLFILLKQKGNAEKTNQIQSIYQKVLQFVTNPTYENLSNAKNIRDMLERTFVGIFLKKYFFS